MDLIKMLIEAQGGGLLKQVADRCGVDERQAGAAVQSMLPSLAEGMKGNIAKQGGLEDLLNAVKSGNHSRYIDNPSELASPGSIEDGNGILGHLLGSKDRSRQVAAQAAQQTGIDPSILKSMLPMIAAAMMGGISKTASTGGLGQQPDAPIPSGGNPLDAITGGGGFGAILGKMLESSLPQAQPTPQAPPPPRKSGMMDILGKLFKRNKR